MTIPVFVPWKLSKKLVFFYSEKYYISYADFATKRGSKVLTHTLLHRRARRYVGTRKFMLRWYLVVPNCVCKYICTASDIAVFTRALETSLASMHGAVYRCTIDCSAYGCAYSIAHYGPAWCNIFRHTDRPFLVGPNDVVER